MKGSLSTMGFVLPAAKYFARLQLDPTTLDAEPTLTKLQQLQEQHLAHIPFGPGVGTSVATT